MARASSILRGEAYVRAALIPWICRIIMIAVIFWWPPIWRDPIYTPRYAQLTGQRLLLPDGSVPQSDEERAIAIFSRWEDRSFVETKWIIGPYKGVRSSSGRWQTLSVLLALWLIFRVIGWWPPRTRPK